VDEIQNIIQQLQKRISSLDRAVAALKEVGGQGTSTTSDSSMTTARAKRRGHGLTPEGRERIAEAMRQRWAARKAPVESTQGAPSARKRRERRISPEGRARIVEANRRRWASKRRADANAGAGKSSK
jgi:hypothetical protein